MKIPPIVISHKSISDRIKAAGSMPSHHVRLMLGIGALSIEPFVDYYSNRKLDPQTRRYSLTKTVLKILVGTTTGVLSRSLAAGKGSQYLTKLLNNPKKQDFVKKIGLNPATFKKNPEKIKELSAAFGDAVGVCSTALFTICCDVPVINRLMDKVMAKFFPDKAKKNLSSANNQKDVNNAKRN